MSSNMDLYRWVFPFKQQSCHANDLCRWDGSSGSVSHMIEMSDDMGMCFNQNSQNN